MKYIFTPNYDKYEGVRPINIYLLRLLYFLMFIGVGLGACKALINHRIRRSVGPRHVGVTVRLGGVSDLVDLRSVAAAEMAAARLLYDVL